MDMRANVHLGAMGAMTPGRVQDPEGAKHIVISYMTIARSLTTVARHLYKVVCYVDPASCCLHVDQATVTGGKQYSVLQGRRVLLIYKIVVHPEASLTPEKCASKADHRAICQRLVSRLSHLDKYRLVPSQDGRGENEEMADEQARTCEQERKGEQSPRGSGAGLTFTS